jgi:PAS domain S-box-containing protein
MKKTDSKKTDLAALRRKALKKLKEQTDRLHNLSQQDTKRLVTELGTYQIELEMQNEELRRAERELEASRDRYADLYDFAPVGYFLVDDRGLIREVNQTGADLLELSKRSLLNKSFPLFLSDAADQRIFREHCSDVFLKQTRQSCEVSLKRKKAPPLYAQLQSIAANTVDGKADSIRMTVIDITRRKQAKKELQSTHAALEQRAHELDAVNRELEAFSYAVSNDLRAPLRSIEGFSRAILEDYAATLPYTAKDYFKRITSASQRMSQLIDALLSMARLTKNDLWEKTVNMTALAEVAAHEIRKKDPVRRVEFIIDKGMSVQGDTDMLRVVVENLLNNAWKFTGKRETARVDFGVLEPGSKNPKPAIRNPQSAGPKSEMTGKTVYFVRDNGAGFDMAYANKLFTPFQRLHSDAEFPGLGIGLAMVQRIIRRHGGKIWAEGETDKGATFYFTLPHKEKPA